MLFSNVDLNKEVREMPFGNLEGIALGEKGRGRREIFLPTPNGFEDLPAGNHPDFAIGTSKSGKPRLNKTPDQKVYVILSTGRGYTRRGNGFVKFWKGEDRQKPAILGRGNGADGDAGRIGSWDVIVSKVNEGDIFRVTWGGNGYGYDPTIYVVRNGEVHFANQQDIELMFESWGEDVPFTLRSNEGRLILLSEEWETV